MNAPLRIWHPFSNALLDAPPIRVARAEGVYLYTSDGRKILDAVSSWWVNLHGHANRRGHCAASPHDGTRNSRGVHSRCRSGIIVALAQMAARGIDQSFLLRRWFP